MGLAGLPVSLIVEIVELVSILLIGAGAWVLWARSAPAALERRQKRVESTLSDYGAELATIVNQRAAWKAQGEALVEDVEGYFDRIERKRASTAASASKISAARAPQNVAELPRAQQIALARRAAP